MAKVEELKKQLEAAEKAREQALKALELEQSKEGNGALSSAIATLIEYKSFMTPEHRKEVESVIGVRKTRGPRKPNSNKGSTLPFKYMVDGKPWTGRGRKPAEYLAWDKEKPGKPYPTHPDFKEEKAS